MASILFHIHTHTQSLTRLSGGRQLANPASGIWAGHQTLNGLEVELLNVGRG